MHNDSTGSYGVIFSEIKERGLRKIKNSHSRSTIASPPSIPKVIWRSRIYRRKTNSCIATMDISKCIYFQISSFTPSYQKRKLFESPTKLSTPSCICCALLVPRNKEMKRYWSIGHKICCNNSQIHSRYYREHAHDQK